MPKTVSDYADAIMALINEDIAEGAVPAGVSSFSDLHDHVDANDYGLQVGVLDGLEGIENVDRRNERWNEVMDEVDRRLKARARLQ